MPTIKVPDSDDGAFLIPKLGETFSRLKPFMAFQDVRYYLCGICLQGGNGRLRAASTDGHRVAVQDLGAYENDLSVIVPAFAAQRLSGVTNPKVIVENYIPRVTFCNPEIASVGLNQNKAEEIYGKENIEAVEFNLAGNGKSQMLGTAGFVKLVRQKDGPIVGFHAIGARMGEQVGEGQLMVAWESQPEDFDGLIHAHPTQNESIGEAILALAGKPLHTHN